ncbi:hypothetical protein D9757_010063 [Collybiopsis confluens]|nr:hypothetical protein D9757_010063 [Collybiopsis confluens]
MSRVASLAYIIGRTIFMTYPLGNCRQGFFIINCLFPFGLAGSNFLFFLRARAVYMGSKYMTALFAFLWLASFGAAFTIPLASLPDTMNIGNTAYCGALQTENSAMAAVVVPAIYDTIVFLAISYKLMSYSGFAGNRTIRSRILGQDLPEVSRALLRDGQKYYLVTIVSNLATIAVGASSSHVALLYQWMLTGPNLMLTNIMACYVYRHTILSALRDSTPGVNVQVIPTLTIPDRSTQTISALRFSFPGIISTTGSTSTRSTAEGIVVQITSESVTHADVEASAEKVAGKVNGSNDSIA